MATNISVRPDLIRRNKNLMKNENVKSLERVIRVHYENETATQSNEVVIYGQDGIEAARIIYRPKGTETNPGASVWVEAYYEVRCLEDYRLIKK